jgi:GT2 family glycosyltransferase
MNGRLACEVTTVIPTFGRERVLLETIRHLLAQSPPAAKILVVDQTSGHDPATDVTLQQWDKQGQIRWIHLPAPSITRAMNVGLVEASSPLVLFLDDDILPAPGLIGAHAAAFHDARVWAVVGQVLQPGQQVEDAVRQYQTDGLRAYLDFPFNSTRSTYVKNVMAGNLAVRRDRALAIGGFDENFVGAAYRFETEFARRLIDHGGRIRFEPAASIRHLRAASGGTRSRGSHLTSASPDHGVGDYYFALRQRWSVQSLTYVLGRPLREVVTRFHLRRPWWVPVKLLGELRALAWAIRLVRRGPKLICANEQVGVANDALSSRAA